MLEGVHLEVFSLFFFSFRPFLSNWTILNQTQPKGYLQFFIRHGSPFSLPLFNNFFLVIHFKRLYSGLHLFVICFLSVHLNYFHFHRKENKNKQIPMPLVGSNFVLVLEKKRWRGKKERKKKEQERGKEEWRKRRVIEKRGKGR